MSKVEFPKWVYDREKPPIILESGPVPESRAETPAAFYDRPLKIIEDMSKEELDRYSRAAFRRVLDKRNSYEFLMKQVRALANRQ